MALFYFCGQQKLVTFILQICPTGYMGRQPIKNPTHQKYMRVPEEFRQYVIRYRRSSNEPLYMVVGRLFHTMKETKEQLFLESEQKTRTILALTERCRELEKQQWSFE